MNHPLTKTELEMLYRSAFLLWEAGEEEMAVTLFNIADNNRNEIEFNDDYRYRCLDTFGDLVK